MDDLLVLLVLLWSSGLQAEGNLSAGCPPPLAPWPLELGTSSQQPSVEDEGASENGWTDGCFLPSGFQCETANADIVMLVDESTSISPKEFNLIKIFISEIVRKFSISPSRVQIGLTKYSHISVTRWHLNTHQTKESLLKDIEELRQRHGGTEAGQALDHILHHSFNLTVGMRTDSRKIVLLITDGVSADDVHLPAKNLRDNGIEVYAVGVKDADRQDLKVIASEDAKSHVYFVDDFETLETIVNNITINLCYGDTSLVSVRLVNGTRFCSGRLEVKSSLSDQSSQTWSSVCEADFDLQDAEVVCRELGCGPPSVLQGALYGAAQAPMWTKEIQCGGHESSLLDCRRSERNTCSPGKAAELTCSEPVRLVGGASRCEGTFEVKVESWKPVDDSGWTLEEGAAACRKLDCGSVISLGSRNDFPIRPVWKIHPNCLKYGYQLKKCAESSQSSSILKLVCSDLLVQPVISVSSIERVSHAMQQGSAGVLKFSSFTISCSIRPQYPGGSFQLLFSSSNSAINYTQPAVNHSAHFLFTGAEPSHQGNYMCVYHVYVFSHNFSSESQQLCLTVSGVSGGIVFIIRLVVLLLTLLVFISVIHFSHKATRGQRRVQLNNEKHEDQTPL